MQPLIELCITNRFFNIRYVYDFNLNDRLHVLLQLTIPKSLRQHAKSKMDRHARVLPRLPSWIVREWYWYVHFLHRPITNIYTSFDSFQYYSWYYQIDYYRNTLVQLLWCCTNTTKILYQRATDQMMQPKGRRFV